MDEARRLHREGRSQAAVEALESVLRSGATEEEKAAALDLMGTIAVEGGNLPEAHRAWQRLIKDYPDLARSLDTQTKLSLVTALLTERGEGISDEPPSPEATDARADLPAPEPAPAPRPAPALAPVDPPPPPPADARKPTSPLPPKTSSGLVLLAGRGRPHDAVAEVTERLVRRLREQGVDAASATGGIPVVQESELVLPQLLQKGQEAEASSVLLLTAEYTSMQKMVVECYSLGGSELWKLKVSGGTGWTGRESSPSGVNEKLFERFAHKLWKKVGGPGLPVTLR